MPHAGYLLMLGTLLLTKKISNQVELLIGGILHVCHFFAKQ